MVSGETGGGGLVVELSHGFFLYPLIENFLFFSPPSLMLGCGKYMEVAKCGLLVVWRIG